MAAAGARTLKRRPMTASLVQSSRGASRGLPNRTQESGGASRGLPDHTGTLAGLFWAFSYAVLSIRGAIYADDWSQMFSGERALAVTAGAAAYWLVLKQLDSGVRVTLRAAIVWILGATLAIMFARLLIEEAFAFTPGPIGANVRWSLAWSGYFGLWVMGAIAFRRDWARACRVTVERPAATVAAVATPAAAAAPKAADLDNLELVLAAIVAEAATLQASDRAELADRMLKLGGYELAGQEDEYSARHNERAWFALRLSVRLAASAAKP